MVSINVVENIEKYSPHANKWTTITEMFDSRGQFCVCAFWDKVLIFGGLFYNRNAIKIATLAYFKICLYIAF